MESLIKAVTGTGQSTGVSESSSNENGPIERIKIVVAGVGGGGNNTLSRLLKYGIKGADLVAINLTKEFRNCLLENQ